jgi:uncharacterized protein YcfJ
MTKENKKTADSKVIQTEEESGTRTSGEPDSNLAAVGGGGIAGAATGAAVGGAVGGPVGAAIGAAAGAIAGAAAADQIQDELDPKLEEVYWQKNYKNQPYYKPGDKYETYLPAFRFGWESASRREFGNRSFEELEPELQNTWQNLHASHSDWSDVRLIVRDAFYRIRKKREKVGLKNVNP